MNDIKPNTPDKSVKKFSDISNEPGVFDPNKSFDEQASPVANEPETNDTPIVIDNNQNFAKSPSEEPKKMDFTPPQNQKQSRNPFKPLFAKFEALSKKQKIIVLIVALLILAAILYGVYAVFLKKDKPAPVSQQPVAEKKVEAPKPTTEASTLTGIQVPIGSNKRPITSIQIENSPDARPQSGLLQAGVVFEAIAEGGITRFNASFQEAQPDYIGPIRSVRPYYAQLVAPFDPIFVHAGGSGDGLAKLAELGLKDLDHGANGAAFKRVSDRYAPHNLYSSMADLDKAAQGRGYTSSNAKGFLRKDEVKNQPPTITSIAMNISGPLYNTSYTYDAATNTYKRTLADRPHTDYRSGEQISPKVVVAMVAPWSQNGIYSVYGIIGSGEVTIFQDGQMTKGTWNKPSEKEQISFKDATGKPIALDAGQTWITLLRSPGELTANP